MPAIAVAAMMTGLGYVVDRNFGPVVAAVLNALIFMGLLWAAVRWLQQTEGQERASLNALREREEQLSLFIEHSPVALAMLDREMRYLAISHRWLEDFRLSGQNILGRSHYAVFPEIPDHWREIHQRCLAGAVERSEAESFVRGDGSVQWLRREIRPWHESDGKVGGLVIFSEDVTAHKLDEEAHAQLAAIVQSSDDAIIGKTLEGVVTSWNLGAEHIFGYTAAEAVGRPIRFLIPAERIAEETEILDRIRHGDPVHHYETTRRRKDGSLVEVSLTVSPIRDRQGQIIGASKIAREITEQKQAERAQREHEALLRTVTDNARVGLVVLDADRRYLFTNAAYTEILGLPTAQIVGLRVPEVMPRVYDQIKPRLDRAFAGERVSYELRVPTEPDERLYAVTYEPHTDAAGRPQVIVVIVDITERMRAETARHESDQRFRQLAENIDEVFWITNANQTALLYVSPAYEKIWGRDCAALYLSPRAWAEAIHLDDRERVLENYLRLAGLGKYTETYRITRPNGEVRWINDRAFPIRNELGEVYRIAGTARDITEHRKLEERYHHAQRMEAIGTLAGGIAHDFNNILAAVNGYTELARLAVPADNPVHGYLDHVLKAGARATDLVRQILTFSRQPNQQRRTVRLADVVAETLKLLRATIPSSIEFVTRFDPTTATVLADPTQVHQIIMNLGTNAWHAMRDRPGKIEVHLENFHADEQVAASHLHLPAGPYVRLSFADTGKGMDRATMDRIFEPFFTTKPLGEGTGLGLSVVHGIMASHDGAVTVYSEVGQGTVFHLYFPAHGATASGAGIRENGPWPVAAGKRILFVDDEEALALLGQKTLEQLGYQVTVETSPRAALERVRASPADFDLVITDLSMPGMIGVELAKALLQIRPDLPIVLTTGYSPDLTPERVRALGLRDLLPKPHTISTLAQTVHRALAPPA